MFQRRISINAERSFISKIEGGCRFPIAAYTNLSPKNHKINFYAKIFSSDGLEHISIKKIGDYDINRKLSVIWLLVI